MKQVVQDQSQGTVSVIDVPPPVLPSTGVLVAVEASVISSGTERAKIEMGERSMLGKARARPDLARQVVSQVQREGIADTIALVRDRLSTPQPLGYSLAGRVLAVGPSAKGFRTGQLVACGGAGLANHAEVVQVPWTLCAAAPQGLTSDRAAFATVAAIALHGLRQAGLSAGDRVVVSGLGLIGQLAVRLCLAYGHPVVGVDPSPVARREVSEIGVPAVAPDDAMLATFEADAVLLTAATSSSDPVGAAPIWCRDRGVVVVVGDVGLTLPRAPYYDREVELRFSRSYGPGRYDPQYEEEGVDYPKGYVRWTEGRNLGEVLRLLSDGLLNVDDLISARYTIDEAPKAYEHLAHGDRVRAIVLSYPTPAEQRLLGSVQLRPAPPEPAGSGGTLRVGVCGAGNFARKTLLPGLSETGRVSWTTIATATGVTGVHVGSKLGFAAVASEASQVASDPNADAILIATRHDTHADLVATAVKAQKFVFVEKPLAVRRQELDQLVDLEGAQRVVTGFNRRWSPAALAIAGDLASRTGPLLMQMRVNAGQLPAGHWAGTAAQGGRVIGELCHFIDLACFLAGQSATAVEVLGTGRSAPAVEDTVQVLVSFDDGSSAALSYLSNGAKALPKERIELHWQGRSAVIDDFRHWHMFGSEHSRKGDRKQDKGHRRLLQEFVRYALDGGESPVPFHQAVHVTDVSLCVVEALEQGGSVAPAPAEW